MPDLPEAAHLIEHLFRFAPVKNDGPLSELDIEARGRLLGIEWEPWEAEALSKMSQGYHAESVQAVKADAPPPWPDAAPMWRWVQNYHAERKIDRYERQAARIARIEERKKKE